MGTVDVQWVLFGAAFFGVKANGYDLGAVRNVQCVNVFFLTFCIVHDRYQVHADCIWLAAAFFLLPT